MQSDTLDTPLSDPVEEFADSTVLVVDDESNIVTLLQTWLETIGCRVESASDGESGVRRAKELKPDLILLDGMMPKMSGFDACRALKEDDSTKDIPVIFLTVQGEVKDVVKGLELGAHGYMTKPFKPQELLARVRSTLKIKQIQDRLKSHTQKLRQQWNWMHGVVESLPLGLMVFDPKTGEVIYLNERFLEILGLHDGEDKASELPTRLRFLDGDRPAESVWQTEVSVDATLTLVYQERALGSMRVRARTFEKNGKVGRQILVEAP